MNLKTKRNAVIILCFIGIIAAITWYFHPISMGILLDDMQTITVHDTQFRLSGDRPDVDTIAYTELTEAQTQALVQLLEDTTFQRTAYTPFSNGFIRNGGEHIIQIYIFDSNGKISSISISSSGQCVLSKNYFVKNAEALIANILSLVGA